MSQQPDTLDVTWKNFPRAQLHREMEQFAEWGGFGEFYYFRTLIPLDQQVETLPNRDTLYSLGGLRPDRPGHHHQTRRR